MTEERKREGVGGGEVAVLHVCEIHNRSQFRLTWSVGAAMRAWTCGERKVKEGGRKRTLDQWRRLKISPGPNAMC